MRFPERLLLLLCRAFFLLQGLLLLFGLALFLLGSLLGLSLFALSALGREALFIFGGAAGLIRSALLRIRLVVGGRRLMFALLPERRNARSLFPLRLQRLCALPCSAFLSDAGGFSRFSGALLLLLARTLHFRPARGFSFPRHCKACLFRGRSRLCDTGTFGLSLLRSFLLCALAEGALGCGEVGSSQGALAALSCDPRSLSLSGGEALRVAGQPFRGLALASVPRRPFFGCLRFS